MEELSSLINESKELLSCLQDLKLKAEANYSCKFFKYLDKNAISKLILPYLEIKDIFALRQTCREINNAVVSITSYAVLKKKKENKSNKKQINLNMNYINNDLDPNFKGDIKKEIMELNNVKNFLKEKLGESEKIIKVCKNDIDYLKSEIKANVDITNRLNEELKKSRESEIVYKKENTELKDKLQIIEQEYKDYKETKENTVNVMQKELDSLKVDKNKLTTAVVQLKKISDDLKKKNVAKGEALKAIKNFFLNSTLLKLKSISDFDNKDNKDNKDNGSITS